MWIGSMLDKWVKFICFSGWFVIQMQLIINLKIKKLLITVNHFFTISCYVPVYFIIWNTYDCMLFAQRRVAASTVQVDTHWFFGRWLETRHMLISTRIWCSCYRFTCINGKWKSIDRTNNGCRSHSHCEQFLLKHFFTILFDSFFLTEQMKKLFVKMKCFFGIGICKIFFFLLRYAVLYF